MFLFMLMYFRAIFFKIFFQKQKVNKNRKNKHLNAENRSLYMNIGYT